MRILLRWPRRLFAPVIVRGALASLAPGAAEVQLDRHALLRLRFPVVPKTNVGLVKQIVPALKGQGCMSDKAAESIRQSGARTA